MELALRQLIANTQHDFQRFSDSPDDNNLKVCLLRRLKGMQRAYAHACVHVHVG